MKYCLFFSEVPAIIDAYSGIDPQKIAFEMTDTTVPKTILATPFFNTRKDGAGLKEKRQERIREAIAFPTGTFDSPMRNVVSQLPNGKDVYFLKPGRETLRRIPNPFDMYPNVGNEFNS